MSYCCIESLFNFTRRLNPTIRFDKEYKGLFRVNFHRDMAREIYAELATYPIPTKPIFCIPIDDRIHHPTWSSTIDDIIRYNLQSLVPNVDMGLHQETRTTDDVQKWIDSTKEYGRVVMNIFYSNILRQERKLQNIIHQRESCSRLSMGRLERFPPDIIRHIRGYLLPETRILFYMNKYTNIGDLVKKMPNECLKRFYREVVHKQYYEISTYIRYANYRNYRSCLPQHFSIRLNPPNKVGYSEDINYLIHSFRNTTPITPESYTFFQTRALRLIQTIIYITEYRKPWLSKSKRRTQEIAHI